MAITSVFQTEYERSIRFTGSKCGYCIMVVFVFWGHEASVRFTLPALKTDIKKVKRKGENAMLSISIKFEQMNITSTRRDDVVAFWYCTEGRPCIRS